MINFQATLNKKKLDQLKETTTKQKHSSYLMQTEKMNPETKCFEMRMTINNLSDLAPIIKFKKVE